MRTVLAVLCLVILVGCENGFYDRVSENTQDPGISQPQAVAFAVLTGIPVSWAKDKNADGYILYRRILSSNTTQTIYQGASQSFLDSSAVPDTMYAYTLAKYRGSKIFVAGAQSVGAWDLTYTESPNGSCHTQATAIPMVSDTISGQIFYYSEVDAQSGQNVVLDDPDWYYVDLGPRLQYFFVFVYETINQSGDLIVSTTTDNIATNNEELSVTNPSTAPQRVFFSVKFNPAVASVGTQTRVDYQVQFKQIATYVPTN